MINDQIDSEIEVYTCRLCGHVESVLADHGNRPARCAKCRIESSFVLIDIRSKADHARIR